MINNKYEAFYIFFNNYQKINCINYKLIYFINIFFYLIKL